MKKICLLVLLLCVGKASFSQNVISLFNKANNFFYYMEEGKYDSAHFYFDETEQAKVSVENLKQIWTSIKSKLGNVKSLEAIQSKIQGQFFSVVVEGKFDNDNQNFILGFNKADEITIVFCGSKKTLASGLPMAKILFVGHPIGMLILPLILFHQIQLIVCGILAARYAGRIETNGQSID
ncbi:MAG: DUF3887 domain-containing protein [Chitinophagaceae bacterium]|nr:MAG: DUF3887 domain-containing protein [Chitinophagaceae bacterium]